MPHSPQRWSDHWCERIISRLLFFGVLFSTTLVVIGGIRYLVRHYADPVELHYFHGEPNNLRYPREIIIEGIKGKPLRTIQLGILLLLITPLARVIFSVYAFYRQKDYLYLVFTLIVLTVLLASLLSNYHAT